MAQIEADVVAWGRRLESIAWSHCLDLPQLPHFAATSV